MVGTEDVRQALTNIGLWCIEHDEDDVVIKFSCIRNHRSSDTVRVITFLAGDWNTVGKVTRDKDGNAEGVFNTEDGVALWETE